MTDRAWWRAGRSGLLAERWGLGVRVSICLSGSAIVLACASGAGQGRGAAHAAGVAARDTRIVHEECPLDESGAERQDVNSDGRVDRTIVRDGGLERCRALDLNFDGAIDAWVYLDASGKVRRRESDYDRDGRVDEIAIYKDGVLAERQRATSLLGKLDTWQFYEGGKVTRAERDSNGDDVVDQWWEYSLARGADCPLIHSDVDGDGRPDPGATVDVCGEQHVPLARDGSSRPPGAPGLEGGDLPTEVDPAQPPTEEAAPAQQPANNTAGPATTNGGKAP